MLCSIGRVVGGAHGQVNHGLEAACQVAAGDAGRKRSPHPPQPVGYRMMRPNT